ncbi:MAG: SHOCT domain-containing protein [Firmicutes bacterium]|jgi:uncharacterized membrane protein|nr:SHOCT domain-containing protein [Bacillota bacterium]
MTLRDLTVVLLFLGASVLLPVLAMSLGGFGMMGSGMMGGWGAGQGFARLGGPGLPTVLLLAAAVLIVLALTRREAPDRALEILKQRLARGEISPEQYAELNKTLQ